MNPPPTSSYTQNNTYFEEYSGENEEARVIGDNKNFVDAKVRLIDKKPA